jgi:hypothetical protein
VYIKKNGRTGVYTLIFYFYMPVSVYTASRRCVCCGDSHAGVRPSVGGCGGNIQGLRRTEPWIYGLGCICVSV